MGLTLRLVLAPFTGHYYDIVSFINVAHSIERGYLPFLPHELGGFVRGVPPYSWDTTWTAYPPPWPSWLGVTYVLAGKNLHLQILLIKLPMILADCLVALHIHGVVSGAVGPSIGLAALRAFFLLPPSLFIGSVWGMPDILGAMLVLFSLRASMRAAWSRSAFYLSLAQSIKPILFFQSPVVIIYAFKKGVARGILYASTVALTFILLVLVPFGLVLDARTILTRFLPNLVVTYAQRLQQTDVGWSIYGILVMIGGPMPFLPSFALLSLSLLLIYGWLFRPGSRTHPGFYLYGLALSGTITFLLLGRTNPQYFMTIFPFMVLTAYLNPANRLHRLAFHASWISWFFSVSLQQNLLRFLNPVLPQVGTVREIHGNWYGNPNSPLISERLYFELIHSPWTSWVLPTSIALSVIFLMLYLTILVNELRQPKFGSSLERA